MHARVECELSLDDGHRLRQHQTEAGRECGRYPAVAAVDSLGGRHSPSCWTCRKRPALTAEDVACRTFRSLTRCADSRRPDRHQERAVLLSPVHGKTAENECGE